MNITELAVELKLSYIRQNYSKIIKQTAITHEELLLQLLSGEYENTSIPETN
jgi:hypothetical protein